MPKKEGLSCTPNHLLNDKKGNNVNIIDQKSIPLGKLTDTQKMNLLFSQTICWKFIEEIIES
jgi:hypothetical protein